LYGATQLKVPGVVKIACPQWNGNTMKLSALLGLLPNEFVANTLNVYGILLSRPVTVTANDPAVDILPTRPSGVLTAV
jgi:hypothetical protein